jgi:hypothetical protein
MCAPRPDMMAPIVAASGRRHCGLAGRRHASPQQSAGQRALKGGSGWLALTDNQQFRVLSVRETPLFSTLASLGVLLLALSFMWYREGR